MADQNHVRADKATTYLAAGGVFSTAMWGLGILVAAPVVGAAIAVGAVALAMSEKGRGFFQKLGDQLLNLGNDTLSHASEDYSRVQNWWQRKTEARKAAKTVKAAPAPQETSTFTGFTQAPGFNHVAVPAAEAPKEEQKPAPAPVPAPKPPAL